MSEDRLEKIIKENREYFDNKTPSSSVWKNIRFRMGFNSHTTGFIWKAAAILFFSLSAYLLIERQDIVQPGVAEVKSEFRETESFYMDEIRAKTELITQLTDRTILGEQAERDLIRLDAMYQVLKDEYKKDPSKEVVDALILNLLLRIDILNDELERLDSGDEEELSI